MVRAAKGALPASFARRGLPSDAAATLNEAGDRFVRQVADRAHGLAEAAAAKAKRKRCTVDEGHVVAALEELGAPAAFVKQVRAAAEGETASGEAKKAAGAKKRQRAKMTPEERTALAAEQEALFTASMAGREP